MVRYREDHNAFLMEIIQSPPEKARQIIEETPTAQLAEFARQNSPLGLIALFRHRLHEISQDGLSDYEIGRILDIQERIDEAEECYRKALEAGDMEAHANLGVILYNKGQREEAKRHFEAGTNSAAKNRLGDMVFKEKKFEEALAAYQEALALAHEEGVNDFQIGVIHYEIANCYMSSTQSVKKNWSEAIRHAQQAQKLGVLTGVFLEADIYFMLGQFKDAPDLLYATAVIKRSGEAYFRLGIVHMQDDGKFAQLCFDKAREYGYTITPENQELILQTMTSLAYTRAGSRKPS